MGNPSWKAGGPSPNPAGRTPHRDKPKKRSGKEDVLKKKIASYLTSKWDRMVSDMDGLSEKDRSRAYLELMQFSISKKAPERPEQLSSSDIDRLYEQIMDTVKKAV